MKSINEERDLFSFPEVRVWTVTELTRRVKSLFDSQEEFYEIAVRGEITNVSRSNAGHIYFGLKDSGAYLKCVAFRSSAERLKVQPEDGLEAIAIGRLTVYEAGGNYQLIVESLETIGKGALWLKFEEVRRRLEAEGLFDEALKRRLPAFPRVIGIVTSPDGAALRDILKILKERSPYIRCILSPSLVQGETAPESLIRAIDLLERWDEMERKAGRDGIDLMIIGRGGGSVEDLACFNDERLARRIRAVRVPVISAVGHEIDFSIADFVADMRAATPTQAAALAAPSADDLRASVLTFLAEFKDAARIQVETYRGRLENILSRPIYVRPLDAVNARRQNIDRLIFHANQLLASRMSDFRYRLQLLQGKLQTLNPEAILNRGYSIAFRSDTGKLISRVEHAPEGSPVDLKVSNGIIKLTVNKEQSKS